MKIKLSQDEVEKYSAFYNKDNEFARYCRFLQSKWRTEKGYTKPEGKLGNYIELDFAKKSKANFITEKIGDLVFEEIRNSKKLGKLISQPRIWNNLLSSQPLAFNLFGELYYDLNYATVFFNKLYPTIIKEILGIRFEYSPGRSNYNYTGDRSAFDVFVKYKSQDQDKIGFLGIEVKYTESLSEESEKKAEQTFENHKDKYIELTEKSGNFKEGCLSALKKPPLSQIWRDHLLAISLLKEYDEGYFVFLYPKGNMKCDSATKLYSDLLEDGTNNTFKKLHLETCIDILMSMNNNTWVTEFKNRYLG